MIADANQKRKAISYCVATGMVPFLEVIVRNETDTEDVKTDLTDLDVVGIQLIGCDKPKRVLFDCKTLQKVSPINRGLWAKGAMEYVGFQEAFVILRKTALEGHRFAAKALNVHLFDEALFDHYAGAACADYSDNPSYLCHLDAWEAWRKIPKSSPLLETLFWYMNDVIPIESNHLKVLRALTVQFKGAAGELDPANSQSIAVFYGYLSALALCMTQVVGDLRNMFDSRMDVAVFDKLVTRYVWEGKENYNVRNRLHRFVEAQLGNEKHEGPLSDLKLPGWSGFLEMTRLFLEAPSQIARCVLPLKELSLRALDEGQEEGDMRIQRGLSSNDRTLQFCLKLSSYAVQASRVPKKLVERITTELTQLKALAKESRR